MANMGVSLQVLSIMLHSTRAVSRRVYIEIQVRIGCYKKLIIFFLPLADYSQVSLLKVSSCYDIKQNSKESEGS